MLDLYFFFLKIITIGLDLIALITLGFKHFKHIREDALRVREYFYFIKSM